MTQTEIETLLKLLLALVEANTTAIESLSNRFSSYTTLTNYNSLSSTVSSNSTDISTLETLVALLQTSIGLINKLSKLLDTNIIDITKNDILLWDGDRWTNILPSELGITGSGTTGSTTLQGLSDVLITNKYDGQVLTWSNSQGKWINKTILIETGGNEGITIDDVWSALKDSGTQLINPTHITGSLNLSGLKVNGSTTLTGVTVNGNAIATGEITAYS